MQKASKDDEAVVLPQQRCVGLKLAQKCHQLRRRAVVRELAGVHTLPPQHFVKQLPADAAPLAAFVNVKVKDA